MIEDKDYFDEKFDGLEKLFNSKLETLTTVVSNIETQTTKTNSRVSKLEEFKEYGQHVIDTRPTECPNLPKFEKLTEKQEDLETKLEDALFFVRHPKLFIGFIAVCVVAIIIGAINTVSTMGIKDEMMQQFNELKYPQFFDNTRGQYYNPFTTDSTFIK